MMNVTGWPPMGAPRLRARVAISPKEKVLETSEVKIFVKN